MNVGMIFECGPDGPDYAVCHEVVKRLGGEVEIDPVTLDNKANLIKKCGVNARLLLEGGCDRVLIVWDLRPPWPDSHSTIDCKRECDAVLESLAQEKVAMQDVHLIAAREELEAWFLGDHLGLADYLSTPAHRMKVRKVKNPESQKQPKAVLIKHFMKSPRFHRRYTDYLDAPKLARALDLDRLRRAASFERLCCKLDEESP